MPEQAIEVGLEVRDGGGRIRGPQGSAHDRAPGVAFVARDRVQLHIREHHGRGVRHDAGEGITEPPSRDVGPLLTREAGVGFADRLAQLDQGADRIEEHRAQGRASVLHGVRPGVGPTR